MKKLILKLLRKLFNKFFLYDKIPIIVVKKLRKLIEKLEIKLKI